MQACRFSGAAIAAFLFIGLHVSRCVLCDKHCQGLASDGANDWFAVPRQAAHTVSCSKNLVYAAFHRIECNLNTRNTTQCNILVNLDVQSPIPVVGPETHGFLCMKISSTVLAMSSLQHVSSCSYSSAAFTAFTPSTIRSFIPPSIKA